MNAKPTRHPAGQGPQGQTRRTAHLSGYTFSLVVCRLRSRKHRANHFCGWFARRRSVVAGGRAPAHPNRAEVDERQRTGPNRSGSKPPHSRVGPTEPGAWFVRSLPLKQGLGSSESAVRRDASHPALCGDQRARLRAVKSASEVVLVSMPPSLRAQGRTMPPAAFPRTGRCASFTTGRRSHPSEERR